MLPAFFVCPVWAAQWTFSPTLSAAETYTDNVTLGPAGSRRGDLITQITPGLSISGSGARLKLNASYSPQLLQRAQEGTREVVHQLSASGNAELVQQLLFLDASSSISQQNISLLGPQAVSNVNNTGNRASVSTFSLSPSLRRTFGSAAQGEARLTYNTVTSASSQSNASGQSSLSDSQSNAMSLRLSSGPAFRLYTWSIGYNRDTTDNAQQRDITTQRIIANGRRMITPQLALTSSVGYEESNYVANDGTAPQGAQFNTGFEWTPSPRTNLSATVGKRYFGTDRAFNFSHRTRLTVWSAGYSEDVTTTRSQALVAASVTTASYLDTLFAANIPDPALRQQAVQSFITQNGLPASFSAPVNFFTNQVSLSKSWRASVAIQGSRNTVFANVFRQNRSLLDTPTTASAAGDFASSSNVTQTGAGLNWNWRISPQAATNAGINFSRNQVPGLGREDNLRSINLGFNRQFQSRLFGSLTYSRSQSVSNQSSANSTENVAMAALNMSF